MKLGTLSQPDFVNALNDLNKKELPAALAYKISKISTKAMEEQKEFLKLRKEVIDRYTIKNEDGTNKLIERDGKNYLDFGDNGDKLDAELGELAEQEVELPKIKMSEIVKSGITLSGAQINDLGELIDGDV